MPIWSKDQSFREVLDCPFALADSVSELGLASRVASRSRINDLPAASALIFASNFKLNGLRKGKDAQPLGTRTHRTSPLWAVKTGLGLAMQAWGWSNVNTKEKDSNSTCAQ